MISFTLEPLKLYLDLCQSVWKLIPFQSALASLWPSNLAFHRHGNDVDSCWLWPKYYIQCYVHIYIMFDTFALTVAANCTDS